MSGLVIACAVLLSAGLGYTRGLLSVVARLLALVLAYAVVWRGTGEVAHWLEQRHWLPGVWAWPVAGCVLLVVSWTVFSQMLRWLLASSTVEGKVVGKVPGAVLGAVLGAGLGVLLVWTGGVLQDSWRLRQSPAVEAKEDDPVRMWSAGMVAAAVRSIMPSSPAGPAFEQWVQDPLSVGGELRYLAGHPALQGLFQQPVNYRVLVQGSVADVERLADFRALAADPRVMHFMAVMGLPGTDDRSRQAALAEILSRYARHFEQLRAQPEYQALASDPELKAALAQGNLLSLLSNDKMRQLAQALASGNGTLAVPSVPEQKKPAEPERPKTLYRWKDAGGRLHITEDKPPEGIQADVVNP